MNRKPEKEKDKKKLFVCLDRSTGKVFYASMVSRNRVQADMRSSWNVEKGASILMRPVPADWQGEAFTPEEIIDNAETVEAQISRQERRGSFHVRILTFDEQDIVNRVRTGQLREDSLKIEMTDAGMISTLRMEGGIGIESAAKIQSVLRDLPKSRRLVLLDMTRLAYFGSGGVALLHMVLKQAAIGEGFIFAILVKPESRIEEVLMKSKIEEVALIFENRENAVTALLKTLLE